jgi:hypothetical protein
LVNDENGSMLADSHNILNRGENYFSQLLNVQAVNDVRQTEMHMPELPWLVPSCFKVQIGFEKQKDMKCQILIKCQQI